MVTCRSMRNMQKAFSLLGVFDRWVGIPLEIPYGRYCSLSHHCCARWYFHFFPVRNGNELRFWMCDARHQNNGRENERSQKVVCLNCCVLRWETTRMRERSLPEKYHLAATSSWVDMSQLQTNSSIFLGSTILCLSRNSLSGWSAVSTSRSTAS